MNHVKKLRLDPRMLVYGIVILAFCLRIYHLDHQSLWWDEAYAVVSTSQPLSSLFEVLLAIRNHVPLYFLAVRLWAILGHTVFNHRFFSVIWGMVGVALTYRVGRTVAGTRVGLTAAFLIAISPFHVWYSQETRMYTMVSTCVLLGNWFLLRLLRRDRRADWLGYGLSMLVAVYTHYLAAFALLAHYVFLSLRYRTLKRVFIKWLFYAGAVVLVFGIWVAVMMFQGGFASAPIGWIAPARWYEPLLTLLVLSAGPTIDPGQAFVYLSLVVCVLAIGLSVVRATRYGMAAELAEAGPADPLGQRKEWIRHSIELLVTWLFVPILALWAISLDLPIPQKRSIYVDRYLIVSLPAFVLLVACGLVYAARRWRSVRPDIVGIVVLLALSGYGLANLYWDPQYARDDWRAALAYLEMARETEDVLLLRPSHTLLLAYYARESIPYQEFPFLFYEEEQEAFLRQEMPSRMQDIAREAPRAWLISSVENTNAHGFPQQRNADLLTIVELDPIKGWLDERYDVLEERRFPGIVLSLYGLGSDG